MENLEEILRSFYLPTMTQVESMMRHGLQLSSSDKKRKVKRKIKEYLQNPYNTVWIRNPVVIDGKHSISIQASSRHYCWPKDNQGPYKTVEVGAPTFKLSKPFVKKYKSDGVYPQVLVGDIINELSQQLFKIKRYERLKKER